MADTGLNPTQGSCAGRSALRNRPLRRLLLGLAASQTGDWLYNVALLAFVYSRTHSTAWLSATTAVRILPFVVLGPLGGVVADRFDRRLTMIVCDLVRAALMVGLLAVALLGGPTVLAPLLAGLSTAASTPYAACVAASLPRLVPDSELGAANAARAVIGPLCIVVGPAIGALILVKGSESVAFAVNAATFLLSAVAVGSIKANGRFAASADRAERTRLRAEMREGLTALWQSGVALRFVGADMMCSLLAGVETVAFVLVGERIGLGLKGYGFMLAALGLGGVAGSVVAGRLASALTPRAAVAVGLFGAALPLYGLPLTHSVPVALALAALTGAGSLVVEVSTETALQRSLDPGVFGRAYGFAFPASIGSIAVGAALAGPLMAAVGFAPALMIAGLVVTTYAATLCTPHRQQRHLVIAG
ncbi:MAG: transporter [Mycobacterium sp.]|nr:transporter [Mycobacterium sp.]